MLKSSRQVFCIMTILTISNLAGRAVTKSNFLKAKTFPERNIGFNDFFKERFSVVKSFLVTSNEKE